MILLTVLILLMVPNTRRVFSAYRNRRVFLINQFKLPYDLRDAGDRVTRGAIRREWFRLIKISIAVVCVAITKIDSMPVAWMIFLRDNGFVAIAILLTVTSIFDELDEHRILHDMKVGPDGHIKQDAK